MTKSHLLIQDARRQFLTEGSMQEGVVNKTIAQSWRRSLNNGVSADSPLSTMTLAHQELEKRRNKNHLLLTQAKPEITTLYEQIAHSHSAVALTDAEGVILHSQGQHILHDLAPSELLSPGYSWGEQHRGTNAIGTAILEQQAVAVQGAEHFVEQLHSFSCYAVPIFGANQQLLGTLNVSNAFSSQQPHTLALVKMAAQLIENRVFRACHQGPIRLHFHPRSDFVGSAWEGIATFSRQGKLLAINRNGLYLLSLKEVPNDFQAIFQPSFTSIVHQVQAHTIFDLIRLNGDGEALQARLEIEAEAPTTDKISTIRTTPKPVKSLVDIPNHDPHIAAVLKQAKLVMNQDISILIQGETGVGKELLASAVHQSSSRAQGPFVAVNCAALPEGLIEAELFGYEEGAFTGARQKGSQGKIEQAHGGTLFLDEIGDMPLLLQARLLRVLQERSVTPLGGNKSKKIDFAIISATNQKLQEKVNSGAFRKDLYYRLNGISLTLPALRERKDLDSLVNHIMETEGASSIEIHEDVLNLFHQHPWPGNIRQLHNVLKTMLALSEGQPLQPQHLPPGFMDEFGQEGVKHSIGQALPPTSGSIDDMTNEAVKLALQHHEGNISAAARELGMSRNRFYRKLKALGLA